MMLIQSLISYGWIFTRIHLLHSVQWDLFNKERHRYFNVNSVSDTNKQAKVTKKVNKKALKVLFYYI